MRFSVTLGPAGPGRDPRSLAELAALAERSGWDAVFLEDYLAYQGRLDLPTYDPWISLAAIATATRRIRLGTTVTPVPRRRPWQLASEAVTLDHLSGGRLILGVGIGDGGDPFLRRVGEPTDAPTRAQRLDEALTVITRLWSGETVTHHGTHYQLDGVRLAAVPVQHPRIPIWVGGDILVPSVRQRIARWDGSCAYKGTPGVGDPAPLTPDDLRTLVSLVAQTRGTTAGFDIKVGGAPDASTTSALAAAGMTWWGRFIGPADPGETREFIRQGPPDLTI
jgi:Luciferase-like monooxygenase